MSMIENLEAQNSFKNMGLSWPFVPDPVAARRSAILCLNSCRHRNLTLYDSGPQMADRGQFPDRKLNFHRTQSV